MAFIEEASGPQRAEGGFSLCVCGDCILCSLEGLVPPWWGLFSIVAIFPAVAICKCLYIYSVLSLANIYDLYNLHGVVMAPA